MWHTGRPAPEQCEGCTLYTSQVRELSFFHSRDVTYTTFCQGPYEESARCRDFMGWEMPRYSALGSLDTLLVGRRVGRMHLVCYLRQGSYVFETYWTTSRGVEVMGNSYSLLDLTVILRFAQNDIRIRIPFPQPEKARPLIKFFLFAVSRSYRRALRRENRFTIQAGKFSADLRQRIWISVLQKLKKF